jgi:hypothetical protein
MYHVYADDFQIYLGDTVDNFARCVEPVNADLRRIHQKSFGNGLILNAGKPMIVCRDRSRLVHPLPVLSLDGEVILYSRILKNLGIIWMSVFRGAIRLKWFVEM